jgi:hypothetical protein
LATVRHGVAFSTTAARNQCLTKSRQSKCHHRQGHRFAKRRTACPPWQYSGGCRVDRHSTSATRQTNRGESP